MEGYQHISYQNQNQTAKKQVQTNQTNYPDYTFPEPSNVQPLTQQANNASDYEKDQAYLRQSHSEVIKLLLANITEEFDQLDYEDSFIYDEYPDIITLLSMVEYIVEQAKMADVQRQSNHQTPVDQFMDYLIEHMVFQELLDRRQRRREAYS